jgi:hypothetical protein
MISGSQRRTRRIYGIAGQQAAARRIGGDGVELVRVVGEPHHPWLDSPGGFPMLDNGLNESG